MLFRMPLSIITEQKEMTTARKLLGVVGWARIIKGSRGTSPNREPITMNYGSFINNKKIADRQKSVKDDHIELLSGLSLNTNGSGELLTPVPHRAIDEKSSLRTTCSIHG